VRKGLDAARAGLRRRFTGRGPLLGLAEFTFYVLLALVLMWPVPLHMTSTFAGGGDARYYPWLNWAVGNMLKHGRIGWHVPGVVWPVGSDIRLLDGQLPTLIGGLWNLVAGPFLAYNLGLITATLLNAWAGRRLGRLVSNRRAVWVMTAVAFSTAPAIATRLRAHFTLYFAFAAALLIEEGVRVARGDHPVRPIRLAVLLFVAYLTGIYFLLFGGIAYVLLVGLSTQRLRVLGRNALGVAIGAGIAFALTTPFLAERLSLARFDRAHGHSPFLLQNMLVAEGDGFSFIAQPRKAWLQLPGQDTLRKNFRGTKSAETVAFPGYLLLLAIAGLLLLRLPLRWPLLATALAIWLFSLGPSLKINGHYFFTTSSDHPVAFMPYTGLGALPGLGSIRTPNRASFTVAAILAVPFAMSMDWLLGRLPARWKQWAVYAAVAGLVATNLFVSVSATKLEGNHVVHGALVEVSDRVRPGQTMLEVPADCLSNGLLLSVDLQILHHTPLIGCQASPSSVAWDSVFKYYGRSAALASLRCTPSVEGPFKGLPFSSRDRFTPKALEALHRELGVRFLLVAKRFLDQPRCQRLQGVVPLLRRYDVLGEDRQWMVIDTEPGSASSVGSG
jgi:hypothetical protein